MEHLQKLKGLDPNDLGEAALLRSRIDQQSELICILKRRADEYLEKCMNQEKQLADVQEKLKVQIDLTDNEKKSAALIYDRFAKLDENHNNLIKLKDEFKCEIEILRQDKLMLQEENHLLKCGSKTKADKAIEALNIDVSCKQAEIADLKQKEGLALYQIRQLEIALSEASSTKENEINSLCKRHEDAVSFLTTQIEDSTKERNKLLSSIQELTTEQNAAQSQLLHLKSILEEKNSRISLLTEELYKEQKRVKELESRFNIESERVSKNERVQLLESKLLTLEERHANLGRQFNAYKEHTNGLLERERELNKKLRRLKSASSTSLVKNAGPLTS